MAAVLSMLSVVLNVQRTSSSFGKVLEATPVWRALPRNNIQSSLTTVRSSARVPTRHKTRARLSVNIDRFSTALSPCLLGSRTIQLQQFRVAHRPRVKTPRPLLHSFVSKKPKDAIAHAAFREARRQASALHKVSDSLRQRLCRHLLIAVNQAGSVRQFAVEPPCR